MRCVPPGGCGLPPPPLYALDAIIGRRRNAFGAEVTWCCANVAAPAGVESRGRDKATLAAEMRREAEESNCRRACMSEIYDLESRNSTILAFTKCSQGS